MHRLPRVTSPKSLYDPLRYGLRALDVMARADASVAAPGRSDESFAPYPLLRSPARDGAALSLRLFSDAADDATGFVLRSDDVRALAPIPGRAAAFFEAHAAGLARGDDDELVVGLPLVVFSQGGQRRTAPLLSWTGGRALWRCDGAVWRLPPGARAGTEIAVPTALELRGAPLDDGPSHALHAGVWSALFGLDAPALARITQAGRAGVGALVRAATVALAAADEDLDAPVADGPLTRDDVRALADAVNARPASRANAQCHPHALAMLLPRGDPTSGLRAELRALLGDAPPARGALAVFLGAAPAASRAAPLWSHGASAPTASQTYAATAFEGSRDLVALRGPPGCGKTTLLHHLTAQSIVAQALGEAWRRTPTRATPWALVVTSTNNAAVDNALAPFVASRALPVGLRVGNRKTLADVTAPTLRAALDALALDDGPSLADARAAFEALAVPARAHQRIVEAEARARTLREGELAGLRARRDALVAWLAAPVTAAPEGLGADAVREAREALVAHVKASRRLVELHVAAPNASPERARRKWSEANARRGPTIARALDALSIERPYRDLDDDDDAVDELARQRDAMEQCVAALDAIERAAEDPERRAALVRVEAELARIEEGDDAVEPPTPDPALVEAALAVRDAWARAHRPRLVPLLLDALALMLDEPRAERARGGLPEVLASLACLFPVAGCTLLSMRASFPLEGDTIDRLVVDEAGQCAPVYTVPALARATRALITGDTAQLPPVYALDDRLDARLARGLDDDATGPFRMGASATTSAQAVAEGRAGASLALVEHFRSQPAIVALASRWSGYALDVRTPPRSLGGVSPQLSAAVIVRDVRGVGERGPEGVVNEAEGRRVVALVEALVRDGVAPRDIAVLTPFVGQCARLERALQRSGLVRDDGVLVRTVHKLQGGERRVVVFSLAATERKHLRWLAARPHLLHVATSRAQDHLVVFLDVERARGETLLAPLVSAAQR